VNGDAGIIDEIVERVSRLDDDTICEIGTAIETLMVSRRAAAYEAQHRIVVRFHEPCKRGKQLCTGAGLQLSTRIRRWWRRYDIEVERVPRRGTVLRLIDWRMREWREIVVARHAVGRIVKFLNDAAPGRVQIAALNGTLGDFLDVPSVCRQTLVAAIAAAITDVEK
jgi:hypothetical protein